MSIALYRKYRPATFGEVRGQEHVTEPLRQALRNGRVNHAYLFSGPRGCGKTSSARILARSLNCDQGPTPDPCGECEACVALAPDGPGSIDVIEIDAASHGGVDDARDLRERAFFAPVNSRFKVYIIDEAHMVTREGFNALLKLVEEPPPHLKFVFATTEPDKVIGTIRSRTHHYPFRLIPPSTLRELIEEILTDEGVAFDPAALPLVVRAGAGSARDSLSIMDQLLAGSDENGVTRDGAVGLLGFTDSGLLGDMVDALGGADGAAVFGLIDRVMEGGHDPRRFTADLLERVRDLVVLAAVPDALDKGLINVAPDAVERMGEQARSVGAARLTRAADILNDGLTDMRGATSPRLLLELTCARILLPGAAGGGGDDSGALVARLEQLERRMSSGQAAVPSPAPAQPAAPSAPDPSPAPSREPGPAQRQPSAPPAAAGGADEEPRPAPAADADWGVPDDPGPGPAAGRSGQAAPPAPQPDPAPAAPAGSADAPAQQGGALDLATVQEAWGRIMQAVYGVKKSVWIWLSGMDVKPVAAENGTIQLGFSRANDAKALASSGNDQVVVQAVRQVLGVDARVSGIAANQAPQRSAPPQPSPPAAAPEPADWDTSAAARPDHGPGPSPSAALAADEPDTHGGGAGPRASAAPGPPAMPHQQEPPPDPFEDAQAPPPDPFESPVPAPQPDHGPGPGGGDGSAPASEPAPVPESAPAPSPPGPADGGTAPRSGSSGFALIESELGGKIINEIDHTAE
ncbi:DNA polymerase III subunit gamma and tau [Streptomonospora salina]|uniref:DNA polymerase III subunit gamma/tau n=1 Tax=Streptomonospora salina TaxID=104205 RepID=A0A841E487_9ACTN|nr:DNA polymerase III subunit gamma and tau [Streptomonospora salina]MBB5998667.1 DNA polymerase-3 subunit gamma/tau [Streptomonospora salina]